MRAAVLDAFPSWSARFEGRSIPWPYLDVKSLVTIGTGQLCDPLSRMGGIDFARIDRSPATQAEIATMWLRTKGEAGRRVDYGRGPVRVEDLGGGHVHWQRLTSLRATPESLDRDLRRRLRDFEVALIKLFPAWNTWPASAQLATLGIAWAAGSDLAREFPNFTAAARAGNWARCAIECHLDETGNPGLHARNLAQQGLFLRALVADPETVQGATASEPPPADAALDPRNALVGAAAPSLIRPPPDDEPDDAA